MPEFNKIVPGKPHFSAHELELAKKHHEIMRTLSDHAPVMGEAGPARPQQAQTQNTSSTTKAQIG